MNKSLSNEDLEVVYDLMAKAIDNVPVEKEQLFLSKLSLTLANLCGDVEVIRKAVGIAKNDL